MFRSMVLSLVFLGLTVLSGPQAWPASETEPPARVSGDLKAMIGESDYQKLGSRLKSLNDGIVAKGLHDFPESKAKLLTGYAYGEYYDWDLYFENIYLSYYGVSQYNFTNFKAFLERQQPDGFVSRTLGIVNPRPTQMFKPFLAQIAVLGSSKTEMITSGFGKISPAMVSV